MDTVISVYLLSLKMSTKIEHPMEKVIPQMDRMYITTVIHSSIVMVVVFLVPSCGIPAVGLK